MLLGENIFSKHAICQDSDMGISRRKEFTSPTLVDTFDPEQIVQESVPDDRAHPESAVVL